VGSEVGDRLEQLTAVELQERGQVLSVASAKQYTHFIARCKGQSPNIVPKWLDVKSKKRREKQSTIEHTAEHSFV
jgi:hypothetical protein